MLEHSEKILRRTVDSYPDGHPDREVASKAHGFVEAYLKSRKRVLAVELFKLEMKDQDVVLDVENEKLTGIRGLEILRDLTLGVFRTNLESFMSPSRIKHLVRTRKAFCYIAHNEIEDVSYEQIARVMGRSDHTTAVHHCKTAPELMDTNEAFKINVDKIVRVIHPERRVDPEPSL